MPSFPPTGSNGLYASNRGANSITVYDAAANGDAAPRRLIAGNATKLLQPQSIAVDNVGQIYTTSKGTPSSTLLVFSTSALGNATPFKEFNITASTACGGYGGIHFGAVALDLSNDVSISSNTCSHDNSSYLQTFSPNATSGALPIRAATWTNFATSLSLGPIAFHESNVLYGAGVQKIYTFASSVAGSNPPPLTAAPVQAPRSAFDTPVALSYDPNGALHVLSGLGLAVYGNGAQLVTTTSGVSGIALAVDAAGNSYVANNGATNSISVYSSSGGSGPTVVLTVPSTINGADATISGLASDMAHFLYVSYNNQSLILGYKLPLSPGSLPVRTIHLNPFCCVNPFSTTTDSDGNLYAAESDGNGLNYIAVYGPGSGDNAIRTLTLSPGLQQGESIATDGEGKLYVDKVNSTNGIDVYAKDASGTAQPLGRVSGNNTGFNNDQSAGNIFAVNAVGGVAVSDGPEIVFFASADGTNQVPSWTIQGSSSVFLAESMVFDTLGGLYIASPFQRTVYIFPRSGTAVSSQPRTLSTLIQPTAVTVAPDGTLFVGGGDQIRVYGSGANGTAVPIRVISGSATGLSDVSGLSLMQ